MDYKKMYEEALDKARIYRDNAKAINDPSAERYESIFPELAESEEEKIRKFLIDYFHAIGSTCSDGMWKGFSLNDIYSWLENNKPEEDDEVKTLKIKDGFWYACIKDVYEGGQRLYSKGDIVKADNFMLSLDEVTAALAFRQVFFPYQPVEEFCEDIQEPFSKTERNKENEHEVERLLFLISLALEQNYISESECVTLRNFVRSFNRKK